MDVSTIFDSDYSLVMINRVTNISHFICIHSFCTDLTWCSCLFKFVLQAVKLLLYVLQLENLHSVYYWHVVVVVVVY